MRVNGRMFSNSMKIAARLINQMNWLKSIFINHGCLHIEICDKNEVLEFNSKQKVKFCPIQLDFEHVSIRKWSHRIPTILV